MATMDVTTARAIIKQAIKDEIYEGNEPEDDATCISEADQLVDNAEQAWAQYIRGSEVETILRLANRMPQNGGEPSEDSHSDISQQSESIEDDDEQESEEAPEVNLEDIDPSLMKVEPWEGYGEDRVKDITEGINVALQEGGDVESLLLHIVAFESTHKKRARVLKHVKDAFERVGGDAPSEAQAQDSLPGDVSQVEGDDTSSEAEPEGSDATDNTESEVGSTTSETGITERQPAPEASKQGSEGGSGGRSRSTGEEDRNPAYRALVEGVERQLEGERTHIPKPLTEAVPDLPWRWDDISDSALRDFLMQYSSAAYYAQYVSTRNERIAMHCRDAADELSRELMKAADKYDEKGKQKSVTLLEAEVESDPNVRAWRKRQRKHEQFALAAKREMESQHKMVESMSRLETMRHNAYERSRR